jgi:repressor LexA|nr:MAG TPA: Repressor protein CI [Caudoviricetes sp.]
MDIKNRIYEYLRIVKMTPAEFERNTGLSNGYLRNIKNSIGVDKISNIVSVYPDLNIEWLITGNGEMLKSNHTSSTTSSAQVQISANTKPRIPYTAAAGSITNAVEGVTESQCEQVPIVSSFPNYDFTIIIKGDSMEPKYEGGDEVACKRVDGTSFIQWGKVHVLDTAQGIVIKRIYEDGDKIKCVSYNPEYPPFSIDKSEIYSISLVVGLLRI